MRASTLPAHGTALVAVLGFLAPAHGAAHTWRIKEIFSSADGTVQFIELVETCNSANETSLSGHQVKSNTNTVNLVSLPAGSSAGKHLLLGTANLPSFGGPTPDYVIPANFFSLVGDTIQYTPYHSCVISSGSVPTDGANSLNRSGTCSGSTCPTTIALNSPTNFAGQTGSITLATCTDNDGDGYGDPGDASCPNGSAQDCDDDNPSISPGEAEACMDLIDNDCDGLVDCDDPECLEDLGNVHCVPTVSAWGALCLSLLLVTAGSIRAGRWGKTGQPT